MRRVVCKSDALQRAKEPQEQQAEQVQNDKTHNKPSIIKVRNIIYNQSNISNNNIVLFICQCKKYMLKYNQGEKNEQI